MPFAADEGLVTENEEATVYTLASDGGWVTFVNKSTGATFNLPAHTQAEKEARWWGPGVWTSKEDLLDDKALEIIASIKNKPRSNKGRGILAFHVQQQKDRKPMPPINISKRLVKPYVAPSWTNDPSLHQMTFSPALTLTPKLRNLHNRRYATSRAFRLSKTFSWHLYFLLLMVWVKGAEGTHLFLD